MLIDAHVHLNDYHDHRHDHPPRLQDNVQELWDKMAERGVDHAVVITSYKVDFDRPSVEEILETLAGDSRCTVVEGIRWSPDDRSDLEAVRERIDLGLVRGLKLYPGYQPYAINDPSLAPVYDLGADANVPVLVHTGDTYARGAKVRNAHPLLLDDVAVDHPDTTLVMCHAGNPWFVDAAEVLYKNENVYADISGLTLGAFEADFERLMVRRLEEMIQYMGAEERKLMYGSDWPLVAMSPYLDFLERLPIKADAKEALSWRTAAMVYGIPAPADD